MVDPVGALAVEHRLNVHKQKFQIGAGLIGSLNALDIHGVEIILPGLGSGRDLQLPDLHIIGEFREDGSGDLIILQGIDQRLAQGPVFNGVFICQHLRRNAHLHSC